MTVTHSRICGLSTNRGMDRYSVMCRSFASLSVCQTTVGAGQDISATGHAIDKAATKAMS